MLKLKDFKALKIDSSKAVVGGEKTYSQTSSGATYDVIDCDNGTFTDPSGTYPMGPCK